MGAIDTNIVNLALPVMSHELNVTSSMITWVASIYLIIMTSSILLFGRLGDIFGKTTVFKYGILAFTVGSFFCGMSQTFEMLIFARIIQAVGTGATMANCLGIISDSFPKAERGRALGINAACVALGTLLGPSLGGLVITLAGWQCLFWFNVPIGAAIFAASFRFFPKAEKSAGKFDFPGSIFFILSCVPLFFALQHGQAMGFSNPLIILCFILSVVSFALFIMFQNRSKNPLLHLDIFKNKWFSISLFCSFTSHVAMSCYNIINPFYLQDVRKLTAGAAGIYMTVYPLNLMLVSLIAGYLSDKLGSEMLTLIGLTLTSAGLFFMSTLDTGTPLIYMVIYITIIAIGNALFQPPNNAIVMSLLPKNRLGIGGSVNALIRCIGQTAGIAASSTLLYSGMSLFIGRHVTNYINGRDDAFLFGMRIAYVSAASICLAGVIITTLRFYKRRIKKPVEI